MNQRDLFINFVESARGFDISHKLKLVLFIAGSKPNAYVVLKIAPENLGEKAHFERHLSMINILFRVSRPKSYEEIVQVRNGIVRWQICGVWYGYDLLWTKNSQKLFGKYRQFLRLQKHSSADRIAGKLYGYPSCCVEEYSSEHNLGYLKSKYDYCSFYRSLRLLGKKFPFIFHYACSQDCRATIMLNKKYSGVIKKYSLRIWREFSCKKIVFADVLVDAESDVLDDNGRSLWPVRNCHEYSLVSLHPVEGHFFLFSVLAKSIIPRGTAASVRIVLRHNFADVRILRLKGFAGRSQHHRKFLVVP